MPVLNIYAEEDDLVSPASSMALERYVGTNDYTVRSFPVGHIGMYVSGKVERDRLPRSSLASGALLGHLQTDRKPTDRLGLTLNSNYSSCLVLSRRAECNRS